jgi:hypothetical protein
LTRAGALAKLQASTTRGLRSGDLRRRACACRCEDFLEARIGAQAGEQRICIENP